MPSGGRPASRIALVRIAASRSAVAAHLFVVVAVRNAERGAEAAQQVEVDPGDLGDFAGRVARPVAGDRPLDRHQRQVPGGDRVPKLRQRDPFAAQLFEQPEPRLARLALEVVEEPLGRVVDVRPARHAVNSYRHLRVFYRRMRGRTKSQGERGQA